MSLHKFSSIQSLFQRLGIVFLMLSLTRIIFLLFNYANFKTLNFNDFLVAGWFDAITTVLYFFPFIILSLIHLPVKWQTWKERLLLTYFHLVNTSMIAMNLMDVEYFKFTSKRSTFDLFTVLGAGNDFSQLATTFVKDFWFLLILLVVLSLLSAWLYKRTAKPQIDAKSKAKTTLYQLVIILPLATIVGRGGIQLRPVSTLEAAQMTLSENSAFVLNTPFTLLKSYGRGNLEAVRYFSDTQAKALFNPLKRTIPANILPERTNVVIIILESFGNEFVGAFNRGTTYTPFMDSLINHSLSFKYGIANGKKSIEAVPAIVASIPSYMDNPYISSPYGDNAIQALPSILRKHGYETAFYHGATNGSMRFDAFASKAGFQHYFGRYEYNNDEHFDKTWGILDEYFNPWTAKQLSKLKEPFLGTLFTLSSHHPYYVPPHMRTRVKKGPQPICASINYGDIALQKFFEAAKKQPWYNNTLFVLVADHTPATTSTIYNQRRAMYQIPIVFYHPKKLLGTGIQNTVFQQLDIMPTLLDLLNIRTDYYAFGNSYYQKNPREGIAYLEGSFYYFTKNHMLTFAKEKARNLYNTEFIDKKLVDSISFYKEEKRFVEQRLKAMIQQYNIDLLHNKTRAK